MAHGLCPQLARMLVGVVLLGVVAACTDARSGPGGFDPSGSPAFGGSAGTVSVTSGQTGMDWWTWASSASIPTARNAAAPAQTAQRYLILDFWLKRSNAVAEKVDPARIIAAVATGNAAQQLSDDANLGSALTNIGGDSWGFVASQTATEAVSTVVVCTVVSDAKVGVSLKASPTVLAQAITHNGPGAWTFHLFNEDGGWRVGVVADPSPHLPNSCLGWYAGLRKQAGLAPQVTPTR